ncbi:MAG: YlxR family protein [Roseburia sp.]|nr:YlxR family protein [Roseburia sp.]
MKHVPLRTCVVCRRQADKSEFLRVVRKPDGEIVIDADGRTPGRGAYICRSGSCLRDAVKKRALNRAFKTQIDAEVYEAFVAACDGAIGNGQQNDR